MEVDLMDFGGKFFKLHFRLNYDERRILISFILKLSNMAFKDWTNQYPSREKLMCGKYFNYTHSKSSTYSGHQSKFSWEQ